MNHNNTKSIRVAAVQMISENGDINKNLSHATPFVNEAAQKGAKIILLPEFMASGYILTKDIWNTGELKDGPTVTWLKENSKRLGVFMGASFLEADGEDFFNTFVLTNPKGDEAGRVRKQTPASMEACFTKGESGSHVIDTEIGKIGVGICYENWLSYIPKLMHLHSADIMLMPNSAPTIKAKRFMKKKLEEFDSTQKSLPSYYAKLLGIPVICSNKCGPGPYIKVFKQNSYFPGYSSIVDQDGSFKAQMGDQEGVIVEDISVNPARKIKTPTLHPGRWALDVPFANNFSSVVEAFFKVSYRFNTKRKKRALAISSN